ncbi:MAG TPA: T9SS type A sorting domain-containing protein [Chitinophagales bacterium]|nr:T9SS type A sorting domain-containing protein [Chitinophagales bacterium]
MKRQYNKILMKSLLVFLCFSIVTIKTNAQKQANNWVFGDRAGITWNSGAPIPFSGSVMDQHEGVCSISSYLGQLLFYSDGITVWNRAHNPMPNGDSLSGGSSSTQSAIIVPWPGDTTKYFLFTADEQGGINGIRYSIIDMTLQNGMGDITPSFKNMLLYSPSCEKLTATSHLNGRDIWLVSHQLNTDAFYAYLLTPSGLNTVPVVTNIGMVHPGGSGAYVGYMKFSPDGDKLGLCVNSVSYATAFRFNKATGKVGPLIFHDSNYAQGTNLGPYGIEFSPASNFMYVQSAENGGPLYQYNLQDSNVNASRVFIRNASIFGALQLAVDGKIYLSHFNSRVLSCIENPNNQGVLCNYKDTALVLPQGMWAKYGLPNFVQSYFYQNYISVTGTCFSQESVFSINATFIDSVLWDFGDTASFNNNHSVLLSPTHVFSRLDTFSVTLTVWRNGTASVFHRLVIISNPLPVTITSTDSMICSSDSATLCANSGFASYEWNDGGSTICNTIYSAGNYYLTATDVNGCTVESNRIAVAVYSQPPVSISLNGDTLKAYNSSAYQWYFNGNIIEGAIEDTYVANQAGSYSVTIIDSNGCSAVSNAIVIDSVTETEERSNILLCPNPVSGELIIQTQILITTINIYNAIGEQVVRIMLPINNKVNVRYLATGIYLAEILVGNKWVRTKFVKM